MNAFRLLILAAALAPSCFPATLAVSTYFKDGFTPNAIASDAQGNIFIAGSAVIDPASGTFSAAVAKLNPQASQYVYLTYLDSASSDQVTAIAVDAAGNAYVTGWTTNPNFPVAGGSVGTTALGTPPTSAQDPRSYVTKLSPDGAVLFSVLIGGSVASAAQGIAITAKGQILVSGLATASGFPSTKGAYSVADSNGHWFLMELDPTASTVIFSATGIGGSSLVVDASGNIYLAGSSAGTDYPTTPGAYQTTIPQGGVCYGFCQSGFPGVSQHVTKVDPTGSTLLYSTGLNTSTGSSGDTANTGLAVDAAGNAYVTGTLLEADYPFTVTPPANYSGYLTKLNATGSALLFSIPVGGGGVALDSSGALYVGGIVSSYQPTLSFFNTSVAPIAPPAVFSWVPTPCWPDNIVALSAAYIVKVDPASGNPLDAQWIDGSAPGAVGITIADGVVWISGAASAPDVPFTPATLAPSTIDAASGSGAYIAAVNFVASATAAAAPSVACVMDAANLAHVRAVAGGQALSLFGENLGPSPGVPAPDGTDPAIAGVTVTFDGNPARLLYVSASQINVVVPQPALTAAGVPSSTVMQVSVNGALGIRRQFPLAASNFNLFANLSTTEISCASAVSYISSGVQPLAANAEGSVNTCANPAKLGSTVSFFVDGAGSANLPSPQLQASFGACSSAELNASPINSFVWKVTFPVPASLALCAFTYDLLSTQNSAPVTFTYFGAPVAPLELGTSQPLPMIVWVTQ